MESIEFVGKCKNYGKMWSISVSKEHYIDFKQKGKLIQDAFPELSSDERELLLSGICSECWDKIFAEDNINQEDT